MAANPTELMSFRRTFTLLILLVVLPSAGLSGFGVVAIVNERAAVQKRLEATWGSRLEQLSGELVAALGNVSVRAMGNGVAVLASNGELLSEAGFTLRGNAVEAEDPRLRQALSTVFGELAQLSPEPSIFSISSAQGTFLLVALRRDGTVLGAKLSEDAVEELARRLLAQALPPGESVRVELRAIKHDTGESLVGKLVSQVQEARQAALASTPLAERSLPPPLQDYRLVAVPTGADPVARASTRNRVVYGVLLGVFYLVLASGVVYMARTLYREAKLSRMKTDFVSLVSHELRTPLTSIRMFIETLSLGRVKDPQQEQEVLSLLAKETERLSGMIERVLDWARIEGGRKTYHREQVPVRAVVDTTLGAFRAQRLDADVDLSCEVPEDIPPVDVDREAVAGALLNLVQNAFKYSGPERRIAVRAHRERGGVAIDVEDNGIGIAPRERKRIFERFYRVDSLLTRKTEGSGLGLAIAKRIVEAHGGRITVRSEQGKGSCFTIHLPAGAPRKEASA